MKAILRFRAIALSILLGLPVIAGSLDELRLKAEAGDAESQFALGWKYLEGEAVAKDDGVGKDDATPHGNQGENPCKPGMRKPAATTGTS